AAAMPAPAAEASHATLYTAMSGLFIDVPISPGTPDLDALGVEDPDTALDNGAKPHPWDLTGHTTSPEDDIVENAAGTNINLNADVLFDTDESTLTGKADDILAEAAAEIESYGVTKVDIAGHTDSTGDDAVNKPLSDKRAEAVRTALEDLIDAEVDFTATGHGAAEPIASNDTEEGRLRNRRVTVTIPQDAKPDSAPSPGAGSGATGAPATEFSAKTAEDEKATVRLTGLRRLAGEVVMLTYTVTNDDSEEIGDWTPVDTADPWTYMLTPPSGLSLRDPATEREYGTAGYVPKGESDALLACACSDIDSYLRPGESTGEFTNLMIVPENVTTVDVTGDRLPAMKGVAID
ncbi:outer membrane protein OmpA-like peptidoglycan-associated protein, partial [Murinocardiopsis flavida]